MAPSVVVTVALNSVSVSLTTQVFTQDATCFLDLYKSNNIVDNYILNEIPKREIYTSKYVVIDANKVL